MFERVKFFKNVIGHVNFFDLENRLNLYVIKYFVLSKAHIDKIHDY